jgi:hypothetical protein
MQKAHEGKKEEYIAVRSVNKPKTVEEGYDTESARARPDMLANTMIDTLRSCWEGK